jgi:hypothetical protein
MPQTDSRSSNSLPSTAQIEGVIRILTFLIKIGRYLPWIVLAFAGVNMTISVLSFTLWNSITGGIVNLILAVAGFIFFAQLIQRRKIHRYNYLHSRNHTHGDTNAAEERKVGAKAT